MWNLLFIFVLMRVIAKKTLREFWLKHKDAEQQIKSWHREIDRADWRSPADVRTEYVTASFLADNRVVFNIKGNRYRIVVKINYEFGIVWVRFIGTHAQYDKIDATKV